VPFLLTGLGINQFLGFYAKFRRHLHKVEVFSGVLLIFVGLLVASGQVTRLSQLASSMPNMEAQMLLWLQLKPTKTPVSSSAPASTTSAYEAAPEIELQTVDGQTFRLSDLRGHVVMLNFWATWCVPCRAEIPAFNQLQREHEGQGLQVVGVLSQDTPEALKDFQKEIKQDYTILLGNDEVSTKFGNGPGLPVTIVIDRQGRIRKKIFGGEERAAFEAIIKPLLDDGAATAQKQ
jgi:peroxiredoxin